MLLSRRRAKLRYSLLFLHLRFNTVTQVVSTDRKVKIELLSFLPKDILADRMVLRSVRRPSAQGSTIQSSGSTPAQCNWN
jgi:hypothetical protein